MSAAPVSAQEMADIYGSIYCTYAAFVIFLYDWLLCLDQEIRLIWKWPTGFTIFSLLYVLSRYALFIQNVLAVASNYPMSDLSCKANGWAQNALGILGTFAFSVFSALRAYALSNKNIWLTTIIILLALPPPAVQILYAVNLEFQSLPIPFNCVGSSKLSPTLYDTAYRVMRPSQLAAELLVVGITWWYTYQSYRVRKGVNIGKSISTLIIYNGSIYFLFFVGWYIFDIILNTAPVPAQVLGVDSFLELLYDPIVAPFTCRFMLSLRQFDHNSASAGGIGSTALEFGAQPSDSLPDLVASFAHPLHVDSYFSETDPSDVYGDETEFQDTVDMKELSEAQMAP